MNYGIQGNGQPDLQKAVEILTTAYNAGIVTYDTAAAYGSAEHVLNTFLSQPGIEREKVRIISKTQSADFKIIKDAKCSLNNIGIDYLDGCLLHDAELVFNEEAVKNLKQLKETGIARKVGISVYTPEQAKKCLDYDYVDIIQVPYNILDRRLDKCGFFTGAKEKGLDVYVRSVLLQGLLMMNPETLPVHMRFAESYLRKYQNICDKNEIEYFDCAVGYVLEHPDIDYIVFGVDNLTQLKQYINLYSDLGRGKLNIGEMFGSVFDDVNEKVIMPNLWNKD
ncbi:MAG: aldo/keto reductase [Methanomicrobium sp.]|nr:aldo/keto reductase [Methanomicrobium sp.]